ncbi:Gfo/Idh/MocA family protein [Cyclobacterium jeungdonense]|uniref:Gfo/Idh/MocA family oxidoreductase n=1 Tax=Cyclobacterium jeungdonense TaxID=708087 RepID=A0ABT8C3Q9_9BACT|nr:Gfo/Idh/MocA family oxidoreductase [Cyclobacterium jeungdonense]MDN3686403.1 Gfo/Idh/MocA family oxidoreductase [Cyclobacterium jeungdonense]
MKKNRRDFIKIGSLAGLSALSGWPTESKSSPSPGNFMLKPAGFNMSGYAAPALEKVRIGFVGLGNRGPGAVVRMSKIEGVEIKALCDLRPERISHVKERIKETPHEPAIYTGSEDAWKEMCEREDLDLIYIATPWYLHTPMAVYAMEQGKHAATEVPAAITLDECWQLVEVSEKTRKHCMMLENTCYDFFELLTLNLARQGFFGEIIHGEGAYIHDILDGNFSKTKYYDMWRLKQNMRNGSLYPTHGLGPVAQVMNINRGDRMEYLVSVSSRDFMMAKKAKTLAAQDSFYQQFVGKNFRGNMNTTTIKTNQGRTILLQHDVTSPRPYSRLHTISGTEAYAQKYPLPGKISEGHEGWLSEEAMQSLEEKYQPPIVKKIGELAKQIGGHGGMDFLMDWRMIDCLRNGIPLDMDVYDAAAWSSIGPLSEWSVANRSGAIDVPDFTRGAWKNNTPVDVELSKGGTTRILNV